MSKTIRNVFNKHLTFEALLDAHQRSLKNKGNKKEILTFNIDLETNICNILKKLKNGTYKMGKYTTFTIYEPKQRVVKSLPYTDRIVQQWYIYEFIKPYVMKRFISDTYACLDNKGTHAAVKRVKKYMQLMKRKYDDYYVLKCDVKNFFNSIDKDILYSIMKKIIKDKKLLDLTYKFIYDGEEHGIPIGNYTSQYFANIYLDILDHYVKEKLKIEYYVRYMDDFIILVPDKFQANYLMNKIQKFLIERLNLNLNSKSKYYPNNMGVNFCGYRIYETHLLLRTRFKKNIKKKVYIWNKLNNENKLDSDKMIAEWNSFKAHADHANSHNFKMKIYNKIDKKDIIKI